MVFYRLEIEEGRRKKYAWAFPVYGYPTKNVECECCQRQWKDFRPIYDEKLGFPISLTNEYFADVASCEAMTMVNEKVKQLIEFNNIKSVTFSELPIITQDELSNEEKKKLRDDGYNVKKLSNVKPKYYMLYPEIGACLHEDSNVYWVDEGEYICKHCGYGIGYKQKDYFAHEYIQLDSWKGNDLFKVREFAGAIYCTEKFKKLCEDAELTGIVFSEIEAR